MEKNCEDWFTEDALDVLRRYFARHVYRDGLTSRGWCVPRGAGNDRAIPIPIGS
jgi:hypothetical protein